jgi:phosphoglycerate dehydrogenase-like enzyme
MKILYTPYLTIPSLDAVQRTQIVDAAGPGATLVEASDEVSQKREIAHADVLFGRISRDVFVEHTKLKYYHFIGAGVDSTLWPELVESDIVLASDKGQAGIHLAEHTFALILGLTRGVHTALRTPDYALREPIRKQARELFEQTIGIVGFGGCGRAVARRALAFGMNVIAIDIEDVAPEPGVAEIWKPERLPDLLGASDIVAIALPLTPSTRGLFTLERFRQMRRHAILINVTRGPIVRGSDLQLALDDGLIWGAGLDVTDPEPLPPGHPFWTHPRVLVTPHAAGGSPRRAQRIIDTLSENLRRMRDGRSLLGIIDKRKGY